MSGIAQAIEDNRLRRLVVGKEPVIIGIGPVTIEERLARLEAIVGCAVATEAAGDKASMLRRQHIIRSLCAQAYDVPLSEMMKRSRIQRLAWARFAGAYLMRLLLPMTLDEIARTFNYRDHGNVAYGIGQVADRMSVDAAYAREINELTERVKKELAL